jgi:hypothetical protein
MESSKMILKSIFSLFLFNLVTAGKDSELLRVTQATLYACKNCHAGVNENLK